MWRVACGGCDVAAARAVARVNKVVYEHCVFPENFFLETARSQAKNRCDTPSRCGALRDFFA